MLDLHTELQRIVAALDAAGIPYAVVGGLAVSIYTTPRATQDIDLLVNHAAFEAAARALAPLGFRLAGRPMRLAEGRLEVQRLTKIDGEDILPVDLLAALDPALIPLLEDRSRLDPEGRPLWVIGLAALRTLKRLRNSALDRADLDALGPEE
jgi:hypothetical protein